MIIEYVGQINIAIIIMLIPIFVVFIIPYICDKLGWLECDCNQCNKKQEGKSL